MILNDRGTQIYWACNTGILEMNNKFPIRVCIEKGRKDKLGVRCRMIKCVPINIVYNMTRLGII